MGLSLAVIVALFFLLPGATLVLGFTRLHNPNSPPTALDEHVSVGLVAALLAALVVQGVWFAVVNAITGLASLPTPSAAQFVALLTGVVEKNPDFPKALQSLQTYPLRITMYFLSITSGTWWLGRWLNKSIRRRSTASWFDLLRPQGPDFVWLTLEVHMDGTCFLFAGVATEFSVDRTGNLERVVLEYAVKRPLQPPPAPKWATPPDPWVDIPGEFVVLQVKDTKTINVDYHYLPGDAAEEEGQE